MSSPRVFSVLKNKRFFCCYKRKKFIRNANKNRLVLKWVTDFKRSKCLLCGKEPVHCVKAICLSDGNFWKFSIVSKHYFDGRCLCCLDEPLIIKSIVDDKQEIYKLKNKKRQDRGEVLVLIIYYISTWVTLKNGRRKRKWK